MAPRTRTQGAAAVTLAACLATGCAGRSLKPAIHLDPSFQPASVSEITVLPVLDVRADKKQKTNLEKHVRTAIIKRLQKKKYAARPGRDFGEVDGEITEDDLRAPDEHWIKRIGQPQARFVLVLAVLDVRTKLTFGSSGNAEVLGVLFDKASGTVAWRDKGIGKTGQGGLAGMLMKSSMDETAIGMAVGNLMASFPPHDK